MCPPFGKLRGKWGEGKVRVEQRWAEGGERGEKDWGGMKGKRYKKGGEEE